MRKIKRFFALAKRLDKELEKSHDLFFELRPFLENQELEPVILDQTDEYIERKVDNIIAIEEMVKVVI